MSAYKHPESALIHGGNTVDPLTGAVNIPIYQTSTFQQKALGLQPAWEYARTGNPTRAALSPPAWPPSPPCFPFSRPATRC